MKRILDRLMARQRHLMDRLVTVDAPAPAPAQPAVINDPAKEQAALAEAEGHLEAGALDAARRALEPFSAGATSVRTLTILARLASTGGDFDEAVRLLEQAERIDPMDPKVWRLLADACAVVGRHSDELRYRRQLAFAGAAAPAQTYVDLVRAIQRATPPGVKRNLSEVKTASAKLLAAPDLTPETRRLFAQALYALGPPATKGALEHYEAAWPCGPQERDVSARWCRMVDWCAESGAELARHTEAGRPKFRPSLARLTDVLVNPHLQWTPLVDDAKVAISGYMLHRPKFRSEDPLSPLLMQTRDQLELRLPATEATRAIDRPALLIGGVNQYYHHTVECLSSLAVAELLGVGTDLPLVVNDDLGPFQLEQLAMLGYGEDRLIRVRADETVRFRELRVPSRPVLGGRWIDPLVPQWYRSRFAAGATAGGRRLYLGRSEGLKRRVANESELLSMLTAQGFSVVHPEALGFKEQVALFSSASEIVAPTGAALTNMLFAPPGARVITLYNNHLVQGGGDLYFDALAEACGHRFVGVHCAPASVRTGQRVIDADLMVDIDAVRAALD